MKRTLLLVLLLLPLLLWTVPSAKAESVDNTEASLRELYEELPAETKERLAKLGVEGDTVTSWQTPDPAQLFTALGDYVGAESVGPLATVSILVGIVLLCAATEGLRHSLSEPSLSEVYQGVCAVGMGVALMVPLSGCISRVAEAAHSVTVFMGSFVPVYVAVLISGGQLNIALSYQSLMLVTAEGVAGLITGLILPMMSVSLALGLTGSMGKGLRLGAIGGFLNRCGAWALGTVTTLFVGCLSLRQVIAGTADTVAARAVRLSLSSFVPVVGGALGEALTTLQGSLLLMRSAVGAFGVGATLVILLPPLCACTLWTLGLSLCGTLAETLELDRLSGTFRAIAGVMKVLIGALAACGMVMIIGTALVLLAGKGA